jgi:hypothetical protein
MKGLTVDEARVLGIVAGHQCGTDGKHPCTMEEWRILDRLHHRGALVVCACSDWRKRPRITDLGRLALRVHAAVASGGWVAP